MFDNMIISNIVLPYREVEVWILSLFKVSDSRPITLSKIALSCSVSLNISYKDAIAQITWLQQQKYVMRNVCDFELVIDEYRTVDFGSSSSVLTVVFLPGECVPGLSRFDPRKTWTQVSCTIMAIPARPSPTATRLLPLLVNHGRKLLAHILQQLLILRWTHQHRYHPVTTHVSNVPFSKFAPSPRSALQTSSCATDSKYRRWPLGSWPSAAPAARPSGSRRDSP